MPGSLPACPSSSSSPSSQLEQLLCSLEKKDFGAASELGKCITELTQLSKPVILAIFLLQSCVYIAAIILCRQKRR